MRVPAAFAATPRWYKGRGCAPGSSWWSPLLLLALLLARPAIDKTWENHPAHFWLVLGAAALATALGWSVSVAARRRRDARLLLISLAFIASSGFFGLHALATPGVLLRAERRLRARDPGRTPDRRRVRRGLLPRARRGGQALVVRGANVLLVALVAMMAVWAFVSLTERPPSTTRSRPSSSNGWQLVLAAVGVGLFGLAALGYGRLYRRRPARFVFTFALAFALLAEAMIVIAWATNWQVSWWEWHILMLGAFVLIAHTARTEWHEERFSALYLDETLAGARDVSVVLADLAGFTAFSERHDAAEVAAMLNTYFELIVPLMEQAGGEVHQIVGDELMVIFGRTATTPTTPCTRRGRRSSSSGRQRTWRASTRTGRASGSA